MSQLISKKKVLVNNESYYMVPRKKDDYSDTVSSLKDDFYEEGSGGKYFLASSNDKIKIVLGKNWDHRQKDPNQTDGTKMFSNDWGSPRVFYNNPIELEYCEGTFEEEYGPGSYGLTGAVIKEKIILKTNVNLLGGSSEFLKQWLYYIKTGAVLSSGLKYEPIVRTATPDNSKIVFFDHHHESINPFTIGELEKKNTVGKSFFADVKTYYNERINSKKFEEVVGQNTKLQNSLPSIYSFLRLLLNDNLEENDFFELSPIFSELQTFYDTDSSATLKELYRSVLKKYPLESLVSLYGMIGRDHPDTYDPGKDYDNTKIIENIISLSFDNFDADSLFSSYYNEYTNLIEKDSKFLYSDDKYNRIKALERKMTNLSFSPGSIKFLNKVDQYKKYFPFYVDIQFTANIFTSLGDSMKQLFLTKPFSEAVLATTQPPEGIQKTYLRNFGGAPLINLARPFTQYSEETIYENLDEDLTNSLSAGKVDFSDKNTVNFPFLAELYGQTDVGEYEGLHTGPHLSADDFETSDIRNYITFFKNDFKEPINLDEDCNVIFKKLFSSAFYAKLLDIYKNKRRTYKDLIEGVPAYTEDLFYRIEKTRKLDDADDFEVVQNILIPNTSELDIARYVDTQLKYSDSNSKNIMYKYNVYVHRIVFGSKYRYMWLRPEEDESGQEVPVTAENSNLPPYYEKVDLENQSAINFADNPELGYGLSKKENLNDVPTDGGKASGGALIDGNDPGLPDFENQGDKSIKDPYIVSTDLYSTFRVVVEPSIVLLEDKIFSTPDIIIIDKPPVIPDINIVPYRAINNRVKILMTGATDRYRAKPIIMLDGDAEAFDKIKKAQLTVDNLGNPLKDGKVEFGSDDVVKSFQLFRLQKKPQKYSDFELYDQITQQVYEEKILPNTKYYYTFRAIDEHDHVSNPTPVYEVELIDEKGAVKPIIRTIELEIKENKEKVKDCQKYIYIKPSLKQLHFSNDPEVDGIFSNSNKKKKYKMRITSKGSGKKIDINFSFKKDVKPGNFGAVDLEDWKGAANMILGMDLDEIPNDPND